jgi:hypothetical protein
MEERPTTSSYLVNVEFRRGLPELVKKAYDSCASIVLDRVQQYNVTFFIPTLSHTQPEGTVLWPPANKRYSKSRLSSADSQ